MHGVLPNTIKSDSGKTHKKPGSQAVFSACVKLNLVEQAFLQGGKDLYFCYRVLLFVSIYTHLLVRIPFVEKHVVTGEYGNSHLSSSWLPWKLL